MSKLDIMFELRKRGELPANKVAILTELERRGEIPSHPPSVEGVDGLSEKASPSQIPESEVGEFGQKHPNLYAAGKTLMRPVEKFMEQDMTIPEGIGFMAGGIGAGLINPVAAPFGAAGGLVAVKSAMKGIKDYAKGEGLPIGDVVKTQLKDFKEGVEMALMGEMIGVPLKGIGKAYSWIKNKTGGIWSPAQKAGQILEAHTDYGTLYAKNIEEANKIEQIIPGIKFTPSSKSMGAKEGKLYRSIRLTGEGATKDKELFAANNQAIKNYYQKHFPEKEGIDDVMSFIASKQEAITHDVKKVGGFLESETRDLMKGKDIQKTGEIISESLKTGEEKVGEKFKKLYKEIGDVEKIPANRLADKIDDIMKPLNEWESSVDKNIPDIIKEVKSKLVSPRDEFTLKNFGVKFNELKPASQQTLLANPAFPKGDVPTLSLNNVRALKSEVADDIMDAKNDIKPNRRLIKRLIRFQSSLDDMMKSETMGQKAKTVNEAFKKEVVEPFRQGTVAKVLQQGARGEESRVSDSLIAKEFFRNPDTADDFIKAVGKDKDAVKAMSDYASLNLLEKATNPMTDKIEHGRLARWLFKNKEVLDKFGIRNKFDTVEKATEAMKHIQEMEITFNKSSAAKILSADPEHAIAKAFTGQSKSKGQIAKELLETVKDDKAATKGLKKSFGDYLFKRTEITDADLAGNPIQSVAKIKTAFNQYYPAIRELYKDEPAKIKALLDIQKAYEIMARSGKSQFGGSDTAEKALDTIARVAFPFVTTKLSHLAGLKTAVHELQKHEQKAIDKLLIDAVFDGDTAMDLKILARPSIVGKTKEGKAIYGEPFNAALKRINSKLRYLTSYVINKAVGEPLPSIAGRALKDAVMGEEKINEKEM